jgi:hypothetical protein
MGFTTDMALMFYLAGSRTESTHSVPRTPERGGFDIKHLSALLTGALDGRHFPWRKLLAFAVGLVGALPGAKPLASGRRAIERFAANGTHASQSNLVGGWRADSVETLASLVAVVLTVVLGVAPGYLLGFTAVGAIHGNTITHRRVSAIRAAILLLAVFSGKFYAALRALVSGIRALLSGHKETSCRLVSILVEGMRSRQKAETTIADYLLTTNTTYPRQLHYTTSGEVSQ